MALPYSIDLSMPLRGFLLPLSLPVIVSCPASVFSASPLVPFPLVALPSRQLGSFIFTIQGIVKKKNKKKKASGSTPTVGFYYPLSLLFIYRTCITHPTQSTGCSDGHNIFNMNKFFYLFQQDAIK